MRDWNGKPYHSLDYALKAEFGEKVYKAALNGGFTCPNRDGSLDTRGCIFCLAGSLHFAACEGRISERIERAKALVEKKTKAKHFIAYFQSYTNTYAPISLLESIFTEAILRDDIVALSIATRPDCLSRETVAYLTELNTHADVTVELGLQSSHDATLRRIRRGHDYAAFLRGFEALRRAGIADGILELFSGKIFVERAVYCTVKRSDTHAIEFLQQG